MAIKEKDNKNLKGFAALFVLVLVAAIMFGIGAGIVNLTLGEQRILRNTVAGAQAYYAAEAGIEDAVLRLTKFMNWSSPYSLPVGNALATTTISDLVGGTRTIVSEGAALNRIKKVQAIYQISTAKVSFYYGAQVGDGGIDMGNNSKIKGNVFSNGSVIAETGTGFIDNSIIVARNGNKIKNLSVGGDAIVHTCEDSLIVGKLTYVSGGSIQKCTAGMATSSRPNEIEPEILPISSNQISQWKNYASNGGIINNDVTYAGVLNKGPVQIGTPETPKKLTVNNGAVITLQGSIYVSGDIIFENNAQIKLDRNVYGSLSGMIIADGKITISPGVILGGSGEEGSYILILSTNNSLDPNSPAIYGGNNAAGAILYADNGIIFLKNNIIAREVTGYKLQIENSAEVRYESGLADSDFSGGTGGSWEVTSWREIE